MPALTVMAMAVPEASIGCRRAASTRLATTAVCERSSIASRISANSSAPMRAADLLADRRDES